METKPNTIMENHAYNACMLASDQAARDAVNQHGGQKLFNRLFEQYREYHLNQDPVLVAALYRQSR